MRIASTGCAMALAGLAMGSLANVTEAGHHSEDSRPSIVDIATGNDNFQTLETALLTAELVEALSGEGPFTVFAPTNAAFGKLNQRALKNTLQPDSRDRLTSILTYHVVPGRLTASDLAERSFVTTLDGERLAISFDGSLKLNDSRVLTANVEASNGIIHAIDTVLIPERQNIAEVAQNAGFETLIAAAKAANLVGPLTGNSDLTVFAPTDEAFAKLGKDKIAELLKPENRETLATILKYHIVEGRAYASDVVGGVAPITLAGKPIGVTGASGSLQVNTVDIIKADVNASNGVIHVIDQVLIPPGLGSESKKKSKDMSRSASNDHSGENSREMKTPDINPAEVIELAIERGAPLFNDGQQAACAAIYEVAATSLLAWNGLNWEAENALGKGLWNARRAHSASDRAWILRRALDEAYETLTNRGPQASRH